MFSSSCKKNDINLLNLREINGNFRSPFPHPHHVAMILVQIYLLENYPYITKFLENSVVSVWDLVRSIYQGSPHGLRKESSPDFTSHTPISN